MSFWIFQYDEAIHLLWDFRKVFIEEGGFLFNNSRTFIVKVI